MVGGEAECSAERKYEVVGGHIGVEKKQKIERLNERMKENGTRKEV